MSLCASCAIGHHRGGLGQALLSFLKGVVADGLIPPFRFGPARRASPRLLLDVEMPNSLLAELPLLEAEFATRLECAVLGSSRVQACYVVAWSLPRCSGLLDETADGLFWLPVSDDLSVHFSSSSARASAMRVWLVVFEGPLELGEALAILVKLRFELP